MLDEAEFDRFESKILEPPSPCWVWIGRLDPDGYGLFDFNHRPHRAHLVAYRHHIGEIPESMVVDHLCQNRRCVNPSHLEAIPQAENVNRGRSKKLKGDR